MDTIRAVLGPEIELGMRRPVLRSETTPAAQVRPPALGAGWPGSWTTGCGPVPPVGQSGTPCAEAKRGCKRNNDTLNPTPNSKVRATRIRSLLVGGVRSVSPLTPPLR